MKKRSLLLLLVLATQLASCQSQRNNNQDSTNHTPSPPLADWTVMVYLNGDNDLESAAIDDFLEMAKVGSTDRVNIIAQFDRIDGWDDGSNGRGGDWTGTLRFRITNGMLPIKESALKGFDTEADMADGKTLADFVSWAQNTYPAKHNMLIIWGHGYGWRLFKNLHSGTSEQAQAAKIDNGLLFDKRILIPEAANKAIIEHPVKSISHDDTSGRTMMNRDLQDNVKRVLKKKLDVIGFDVCLMSMVEVGYAMRDVANNMVASEENEPGTGWRQNDWAQALVDSTQDPATATNLDGRALGKKIVESYRSQYSDTRTTTLSALSLDQMNELAAAIDGLADAMTAQLDTSSELATIAAARHACRTYGKPGPGRPAYYNIDLKRFAELLASSTKTPAVKNAAQQVTQAVEAVVFANYAHDPSMLGDFGSHGVAIYFPYSKQEYDEDPLSPSYQDSNTDFPVEFVQTHRWDNFLSNYMNKQ